MQTLLGSAGPFDLVFGLPLHPLAVHVPVVLLPLGAIGVILVLLVPRWRAALAWPVIVMLGIAAVGALVAKLSGEALADRVGSPGRHEDLGNWLLATSVTLFAATLGWWLWQRMETRARRPTGVVGVILGTMLATASLGAIIIAVLTGHTGATAAWGDRVGVAPSASAPSASAPATSAPAATTAPADPSATEGDSISIAEVAQHDDAASCWVAIQGTVYDVTDWIPQHPGGPDRILGICGTEATEAFTDQHQGDDEPPQYLRQFEIGQLAGR